MKTRSKLLPALCLAMSLSVGARAQNSGGWQADGTLVPIDLIAFGSCLRQDKPADILSTIANARPDLFLFMGDNVYGDVPEGATDIAAIRQAYVAQAAKPEVARLRAEIPYLATWDDHDYGRNDAGAEFPFAAASKQAFVEFFDVPAATGMGSIRAPSSAHQGGGYRSSCSTRGHCARR